MKKVFLIVVLIATALTQNSFCQDSAKQARLSQLLTDYLNIKDALVASNGAHAATAAASFVKTVNSIDDQTFPEGTINTLLKDAGKISGTKDIKKQREYFTIFSTNMAAVARAVKLTDKPVYYAYCPMKKAYWLSNEKAIKNPYYGSAMLTCGEVTDTIQ